MSGGPGSPVARIDAPRTGGETRRDRRWWLTSFVIALVVFAVVTVVFMRPAAFSCGTTIVGYPGDATSGGVRLAWTFEQLGGLPFHGTTDLTATPGGERFWVSTWTTSLLVFAPIWVFTHVVGPVCAWNLTLALGLLLSAMAAFALVLVVTRHRSVALIAGGAYGFSAFHQVKLHGHVGYVHAQLLPMLVLVVLVLWGRPTLRRAMLVGVVMAALGYTDGYYLVFGPVAFGGLLVGLLAASRRERALLSERLRGIVVAGLTAGVLLIPIGFGYLSDRSSVDSVAQREASELQTWAARPLDYVLWPRGHPVLGDVLADWRDAQLAGSNWNERTLSLGWLMLGLSVVGATLAIRRGGQGTGVEGISLRHLGSGLLMMGVLAAWTSFPPSPTAGWPFWSPSGILHAAIPFVRVYARLVLVVQLAVVALAAVAMVEVLRSSRFRGSPIRRGVLLALVATVVVGESLTFPPLSAWSYRQAPTAYRWLAAQPDVEEIAEYPVMSPRFLPDNSFLTFQPVHGKALFNATRADDDQAPIQDAIAGLADPQTAGVLRALGVDRLVVHRSLYPGEVPTEPIPPEYETVGMFSFAEDASAQRFGGVNRWAYLAPYYDVEVLRVRPGAAAEVVAGIGEGFYMPEPRGWRTFTWAATTAEIELRALSQTAPEAARVGFTLHSAFGDRRVITVSTDGRRLWQGVVGPEPVAVSFLAPVGQRLEIRSDIAAESVFDRTGSSDPRAIAFGITDLMVSTR